MGDISLNNIYLSNSGVLISRSVSQKQRYIRCGIYYLVEKESHVWADMLYGETVRRGIKH